METTETVSKLRFPGFVDNYSKCQLSDIASFKKGKGVSKADIVQNGQTKCIRYGELYTDYSEVITSIKSYTDLSPDNLILSKEDDVIIPASGETSLDIATASCVKIKDVALGGDLNIIRSKQNGSYLAYYISNRKKLDIARLAQGSSVIHLYPNHLKLLKLNLPSLPEQQKIASFLSSLDDKISQLEKKKTLLETYKRGIMQKIFSHELRFKDENGEEFPEWEEVSLGSIGTFYRGHSYSSENVKTEGLLVLRSSNIKSGYLDLDNDLQFVNNNCRDEINLRKHDLVICMSNGSKRLVGKSAIYKGDNDRDITVGAFCSIFRSGVKISRFLFQLNIYRKFLHVSLAGTNINNLKNSELESIKFYIPKEIAEQQKIYQFISAIESKIEITSTQLEKTREFKKGLLQQMFV